MRAQVNLKLKRRIWQLEMHSFAMLAIIGLIIGYGFYVSSRSAENTASDVQEIRQTAERASIEAEIVVTKLDIVDKAQRFDKILRDMRDGLQSSIFDADINVDGKKVKGDDFDLFNRPILNIFSLNSSVDRANGEYFDVKFDVSDACNHLFEINMRNESSSYFLVQDFGEILNIRRGIADRNFVRLSGPLGKKLFESDYKVISSTLAKKSQSLCEIANESSEFVALKKDIEKIDSLIDRQNASAPFLIAQGKSQSSASAKTSPDSAVLILLVLNKFGPLVIVFFFSSMIVTLYKYNSKLISFYYGRFFAIEALEAAVTYDVFEKLSTNFTPINLDFGKMPLTPIDVTGSVAEKIIEKIDISKFIAKP